MHVLGLKWIGQLTKSCDSERRSVLRDTKKKKINKKNYRIVTHCVGSKFAQQSWTGSSSHLKLPLSLICFVFVALHMAEGWASGQPAQVTSGKAEKGLGWALLGCTPQLLSAHVPTTSRTDFSSFCFREDVFSSLVCPHTHNTGTTHTQSLPAPQSPALICIPLKDQESTRPGKCYPDKQNSKYLPPHG